MVRKSSNDQSASGDWLSEGNPNTEEIVGTRHKDIGEQNVPPMTARRSASDSSKTASETAKKTAREHAAIIAAAHALEGALSSPAVGREVAWRRNIAPVLSEVIEALAAHRESAENLGGVVAEAEAVLGRPPALSAARNQHKRLAREAAEILASLDAADDRRTVREIRKLGWRLAASLHEHRALEADLIMDAFEIDIGGEG